MHCSAAGGSLGASTYRDLLAVDICEGGAGVVGELVARIVSPRYMDLGHVDEPEIYQPLLKSPAVLLSE